MTENKKLVLASGSPRRREILSMAGYDFVQISPDADEVAGGMEPSELAMENSRRKIRAALALEGGVVVCADTVVVIDGEILGKPGSEDGARDMLSRLSGRSHTVITGWAVSDGEKEVCRSSVTEVTMREILPSEIDAYVATGSPLDKAGAYGVQDAGGMFVSGINGDFYTVMGLPLCEISQVLREEFGIVPFEI